MRCRRPARRDSRRARDPGRCRLAVKAGSTGFIARGAAPITAHHCAIHVRAETERRNRHVPLRPLGIEAAGFSTIVRPGDEQLTPRAGSPTRRVGSFEPA
jgi:hypothetical protein